MVYTLSIITVLLFTLITPSEECGTVITTTKTIPKLIEGLFKGKTVVNPAGLPDGRTGNTIKAPGDLTCDFNGKCRWGTETSSGGNFWYKVTGAPNPKVFKRVMGVDQMPDGDYVAHLGVTANGSQILMSDPIICSKDASISFRYWLAKEASFKVCAYKHPTNNDAWCSNTISRKKPLGAGPGTSTSVSIPDQSQRFTIGFKPMSTGLIALDDIYLTANDVLCKKKIDPKPVQPEECTNLECDFNTGRSTCEWIPLKIGKKGKNKFQVYTKHLGNRVSGTPLKPRNGRSFTGVKFEPRHKLSADDAIAELQSKPFTLTDPRMLEFDFWDATNDMQLRLERNGQELFASNKKYTYNDQRWQTALVYLKPGKDIELKFIAENFGNHYGAISIDNLKIFVPASVNSKGKSVCK